MADSYILVIGAAGIDTTGQALTSLVPGSSIPGIITSTSGGVARNVAENLARLGEEVIFLSALGNDSPGQRIQNRLIEAQVDISHFVTSETGHTAAYIALFNQQKTPIYSIDDMSILDEITPQLIYQKRGLIKDARMIMIDSNLSEETLASLFKQVENHNIPVVADPTSTSLAYRLKPYFSQLYMVTPNANEAELLTEQEIHTRQDAVKAAQKLVGMGVDIALITLAELGVIYATSEVTGHIPALTTKIVNITGAADALTGAVMFGLLNDIDIDESVRLGASAAALTLQTDESVIKALTLDALYDV